MTANKSHADFSLSFFLYLWLSAVINLFATESIGLFFCITRHFCPLRPESLVLSPAPCHVKLLRPFLDLFFCISLIFLLWIFVGSIMRICWSFCRNQHAFSSWISVTQSKLRFFFSSPFLTDFLPSYRCFLSISETFKFSLPDFNRSFCFSWCPIKIALVSFPEFDDLLPFSSPQDFFFSWAVSR